jgi:hypothetical protein
MEFLGNLRLPSLNPTAADGFPVKVHGFPGFSIAVLEFIGGKQMVIWISLLHFIVFCSSGWCLSVHMKVYLFFYSGNIYTRTWDYHKQNTQTYDYEGKCRL